MQSNKNIGLSFKAILSLLCFLVVIFPSISHVKNTFAVENQNSSEEELLQKLKEIQEQIKQSNYDLKNTKKEVGTLSSQIKLYDAQISKKSLEIKETDLLIAESELALNHINSELSIIDDEIEKENNFMETAIRALNEYDSDIIKVLLRSGKFSDFFDELNSIQQINVKISDVLKRIKLSKTEYSKIKIILEQEQDEQLLLKSSQEYQKISINQKRGEKNDLLKVTQGKEGLYQKIIKDSEKTVAEIRNQLFVLQNSGGSLRFGDAVKLANFAATLTGISPSFLLAILSYESNIGKNIGTGNWKKDMYDCYVRLGKSAFANTQKAAFLKITSSLNLDPDKMKVSREPAYGCGGAMGAAQFLPSTWLLYEDQISAITGHKPPNPWDMNDAFVASALYLKDLGAGGQTDATEWKAAMRYFAGNNWDKPSLRFYGDDVLELAEKIHKDILAIEK